MKKNKIKIVFTDLDRTLLRDDHTLSDENKAMLSLLKEKRIVTVIATGRNIYSAKKVLRNDLPLDYLIVSSGCGIIDWRSGKVIQENHISTTETKEVLRTLRKHKTDFMVHKPIPKNHEFVYERFRRDNFDFERRMELYEGFAKEINEEPETASQFLAIFKPQELAKFNLAKSKIKNMQVIRATSPLDHNSIWLEVFPKGVSKGHAAAWLCNYLKIDRNYSVGIGNDFNDIDLLDFTRKSFTVENAPPELKEIYPVIASNENNGFAKIMKRMINV